ncbi:MAG: hypothetical protein KatS3mg105_3645 [Gemmatales bacterium]|nr:MAG: hypothetical protein KatS3mg105_3645 [Gemmatales bacterium]
MNRLLIGTLTVVFLVSAIAISNARQEKLDVAVTELVVEKGPRNPWTHLRLNNHSEQFQFAIISDRTGGHRAKIFSRAVQQLNLLQPEFVLSVGDLIEGYTEDRKQLDTQWHEFQSYAAQLEMPFFYVPGNHDVSNSVMGRLWKEKFGPAYYHFVYKNVLFLILNSDDPPGTSSHLSKNQIDYAAKVLAENQHVRWTIVALHKPLWSYADIAKNGWLAIEKALGDRPYTCFCGHHHRFRKFVRNGRNHYQLATTGGVSKLRGVRYGEFDQIAWVTMKKSGPKIAHVLLDGIYPENMQIIPSDEPGVPRNMSRTYPVTGTVYVDGVPAADANITFYRIEGKKKTRTSDGVVEGDGSFQLSTYTAFDGAPKGEYVVVVQGNDKIAIPSKFASADTSPLRATVKDGDNRFTFTLVDR